MKNKPFNFDSAQKGRSMIEMLGVLAIVGVLTVVGVVGFNKALEKYKTNKFLHQISTIQANLNELSNKNGSLNGVNSTAVAVALNIFPEEMLTTYASTGKVMHAFGGEVNLSGDGKSVDVTFSGVFKGAVIESGIHDWGLKNLDITGE